MSKPPDLMQGTLDLLLLKILALEPMNGHAISVRLKQVSSTVLQVSDGSLYPALHKLEQHGWVSASWRVTEKPARQVLPADPAGRRRARKSRQLGPDLHRDHAAAGSQHDQPAHEKLVAAA